VTSIKSVEDNFYTVVRLAGIIQKKPDRFTFDGTDYRVHARVSPEVAASFGGKNRAFKLLRHATMVQRACSTPGNNDLFEPIRASFAAVCDLYPMLRSYYEAARVGGAMHTWMRW
jgi:hypothetical protein